MTEKFVLSPELEKLKQEALADLNSRPRNEAVEFALEMLASGTGLVVPCMWGEIEDDIFKYGAAVIWDRIPEGCWLTKDVEYLVAASNFTRGVPAVVAELEVANPEEGWMLVCPPTLQLDFEI